MKTSVKRRAKNCIRGAVLLACFIAVWYVASCFTQPLFIPAPAAVWEAIVGLAETGQLQKGLAYSFLRITGASALSMLVAIPLSLLIYGVKPIKETYATENSDAHIMFSTTASKSLIMDGIVFRSDFAQAHPDVVTAFIDGIFQANAMYTTEFDYIRSVMPMFAGVSDEEIKAQCGDAEMMGYAENKEVLDSTAPSVYFDMCDIWESLGETVNRKAAMTLFDNQYLLPLASKYSSTSTSTSKPVELTEEQKQEIVNYEALLTKSMTVEFVADTAQFKNPEEAYAIMDEFVSIANTLDGAIIQVEGNINARNYSDSGQALSAERAKAVAKYFIACGIDPNRLITVGNGNTKMVADPGSADAYLNRRTDVFFKIIEE